MKETLTASFIPETNGKITCIAENSVGSSNTTVDVLEDVTNEIKIVSDRLYFSINGSYVNRINCSANTYLYSELAFFQTTTNDGQTKEATRKI